MIDRGKLVADGTSDELKASVGNSSLHLTLQDRSQIEDARRIVSEALGVEAAITPEAARLTAPMLDTSVTPEILIRLRDNGIAVDEITVQKPSLDEVFLTITGHPADDAGADTETDRNVA